ncbi:hypothetical protein [Fibrobacter sp.]|jgi:hypothetical protein|uniref:hypothetical protein n=1 Tax=Fibrobacter sp. TaxID=35828 RepID=UPI0038678E70
MQSWTEIKNIENPTEEQQLEAIKLNWYAISLIQNPTETVQKAAFEKNEQAILYVKCGPCEALKQALNAMDEVKFLAAFKAEPNLLKFITNPVLLKAAVSQDWRIVRKIDGASDDLWAEAVRQSADALKFIHNPGEKVLVAAVERDWKYIQEIEVPTAAVVVAAVKQDYHAFEYVSIRRRTEPVQLAAVRTDWRCIQYLQRASEKVQMEAVKASKDALKLIKNPAPAVKDFCA